MYHVYILESLNHKRRYIGSTQDIQKRLQYHNRGSNKSTKPYRPYKLVYTETFETKREALIKERQLKAYKGGNELKKLIACWDAGVDNRNGL